MKTIEPAIYNIIKDPQTNTEKLVPDSTAKSIQYTDEELKILMDEKLIPKNLATFELEKINKMNKNYKNWIKFIKNNPNFTDKDQLEWFKNNFKTPSVNDLGKELEKEISFFDFMFKNIKRLQDALNNKSNPKTFALPSHPVMFSLITLFAGKPERIPKKILEKPYSDLTPEEKREADIYLSQIFETKEKLDFSEGTEKRIVQSIAIICNNPKVEGTAVISTSVLQQELQIREERLALYIKRTFGPEGIRHLLGLIIGLEENGRTGGFHWNVNEHLTRLGYKRKPNGAFDPELKRMASEIVKIFTGLCITSRRKDKQKESINADFLFMVGGFEVQLSDNNSKSLDPEVKYKPLKKEIINETIKLVATDWWYKNAISPQDGQAPKYTKLLKEIVKENHREHPLTLYLAPLLAIFWRINPERKFKIKHLMEWCDLQTDGKYWTNDLREIESTLEYMKKKNYLGNWTNDEEGLFPSQCKNSLECVITLTPPEWLKQEFTCIQKRNDMAAVSISPKISHAQFLEILNSSGLNNKQFANSIGVSPKLITYIINGKRTITNATSQKIILFLSSKEGNKIDPSKQEYTKIEFE